MSKYQFDVDKHFDDKNTPVEIYLLKAQTAIANELGEKNRISRMIAIAQTMQTLLMLGIKIADFDDATLKKFLIALTEDHA